MTSDPRSLRLWSDRGLLVWDGRALELFDTEGGQGWRVDALTVERVTVDPIDGGGAHLKLYTATGHLATTTVGASAVTELAEMIDRLGARRSAEGF